MENIKLNKMIDHTILKAEATEENVKQLCSEAKEYDFASVCVNSCYAALVSSELKGTDVKTCCVVGFPLGAMSTKAKAYETKIAVEDGADEIDMVINVGYMKAKKFDMVLEDIKAVRAAVPAPKILKVIIETCLLTDEEKVKACELSVEAKADFVKTSTGFSTGGATKEDVDLMKKAVNGKALVKASGGIRDKQTALEMVKAGADRIGASASVEIVK